MTRRLLSAAFALVMALLFAAQAAHYHADPRNHDCVVCASGAQTRAATPPVSILPLPGVTEETLSPSPAPRIPTGWRAPLFSRGPPEA